MKPRERIYEVELDGQVQRVRIEDHGAAEHGMGRHYRIWIGDDPAVDVVGERLSEGSWSLLSEGRSWEAGVSQEDGAHQVDILGVRHDLILVDPQRKALRLAGSEGAAVIRSQMPGRVVRVLSEVGQDVKKGDPLLVIEAMKMENEIKAPREGVIKRIAVSVGDLIETKGLLVELG